MIGSFPAGGTADLLNYRAGPSSEFYLYNDGFVLPDGRALLNGDRKLFVKSLRAYAAGYLDSRTVAIQLGSYATARWTVAENTKAVDSGFRNLGQVYDAGSAQRIRLNASGAIYFGRGNGRGGTTRQPGTQNVWDGGIAGQFDYIQAPTPPTVAAIAIDKSSIELRWAGADNGGGVISGYRLQHSLSALFTNPITRTVGNVGEFVYTDLQPGQTYFFRVATLNELTTAVGSQSVWSNFTGRATLPAGALRTWNGSAHAIADVFVHDGTSFVRPRRITRWNGSAWVDPR